MSYINISVPTHPCTYSINISLLPALNLTKKFCSLTTRSVTRAKSKQKHTTGRLVPFEVLYCTATVYLHTWRCVGLVYACLHCELTSTLGRGMYILFSNLLQIGTHQCYSTATMLLQGILKQHDQYYYCNNAKCINHCHSNGHLSLWPTLGGRQ